MSLSAPARRRAAWIALVAVLAFALLPTLSRAMAVAAGGGWTEVCTPQGMKWVSLDAAAAEDTAPVGAPASLDHCALCGLSAEAAAPLPATAPPPLLPLRGAAPPSLFLQAPATLHAWRSAQPRGPPAGG